jgi:hypothetical protein
VRLFNNLEGLFNKTGALLNIVAMIFDNAPVFLNFWRRLSEDFSGV